MALTVNEFLNQSITSATSVNGKAAYAPITATSYNYRQDLIHHAMQKASLRQYTSELRVSHQEFAARGDDQGWKDSIKYRLANNLSASVIDCARYTSIRNPGDFEHRIYARCYIFTEDSLRQFLEEIIR